MKRRFQKGDLVILKPDVRISFRVLSRKGVVRFAYDHEPPAYEVEFYWCGRSVGKHYLTDEELQPTMFAEEG
jgi:hypothetical protein